MGPDLRRGNSGESGFLLAKRRHSVNFLVNAWGTAVKAIDIQRLQR
jgi:hypothetical protein